MKSPLWTDDACALYHQVLGGAGPKTAALVLSRSKEICLAHGSDPVHWADVLEAYEEVLGTASNR